MGRCLRMTALAAVLAVSPEAGAGVRGDRATAGGPQSVSKVAVNYAKRALQGFDLRVWISNQMTMGQQAWDGLKVDQQGNVYAAGPGGVWIISPASKHLGTIKAPELAANMAWGDEDGRTLYITARTSVYRVRLKVAGIRP